MDRYRVKADREQFTGKRSEQFIVETVAPGVISIKAANGRYLSAVHGSESIRANALKVSDSEKFICMEMPNGNMVLRASGTGLLLSTMNTEGSSATEWVLANAENVTDESSHFSFSVIDSTSAPTP